MTLAHSWALLGFKKISLSSSSEKLKLSIVLVLGALFRSLTCCFIKPITALDVISEGSPENLY